MRGSGQGAVAGRGQQQVAVDLVLTLERTGLTRARQRPELAAFLQHAGRLELETTDLRQVSIKLQNLFGLHDLIARGDDGQRRLVVRAVQYFLFGKRVNRAEAAVAGRDEAHFGFFDAPVHAGGASPDFERLFGGELVAKTVPGFGVDIGHRLNEMHERNSYSKITVHKARPRPSGTKSVRGMTRLTD